MKTKVTFLDADVKTRIGTQFRITRDPLLRFLKLEITMILSAVVFIASRSLVPRDLMLETHLERALFARDPWVPGIDFVQLAVPAWAETLTEVWLLCQQIPH